MKPLSFTSTWLLFYLLSREICSYAITLGWLRFRLSFSLLRSAITCLRGAWSSSSHYDRAPPPMDLVKVESRLID